MANNFVLDLNIKMRYNPPSIEVGRSMVYCNGCYVFNYWALKVIGVVFAALMLLSCDNYNFDVGLGKGFLDLSKDKAGRELVGDQKGLDKGSLESGSESKDQRLVAAGVKDENVLDANETGVKQAIPSVIEAVPVEGDPLLTVKTSLLVEEESLHPVANEVLLLKGEEVQSSSSELNKDYEKIEIKWLDRLSLGHKEALEYFKGVLQDERYKARLGGMHTDRYEDNVQKYAYSEELVFKFLASIGERDAQDMLTQIQNAREAVEQYNGEGDKEDVLYELESGLSYAFYQTKIYDRKPSSEVLSNIKACSESFVKNINNEFVLINNGELAVKAGEDVWVEKFREHLREEEMYLLKMFELLLKDKDVSLKSVSEKFILLDKDIVHKALKKLDELVSPLVKDIGFVALEKMTEEEILQQLESLSEDSRKKLDALCDKLHHIFQRLTGMNLDATEVYKTFQDLVNQAIREFKEDDFSIKYANNAPLTLKRVNK
nr:hypothetical protein LKV13_04760 [Borrelia sp. BU AG58]